MLPIPRTWRAPTAVRWNRWPDEALSDVRRLPEDGVHVWRIGLDVPATRLAGLGAYLTPEEMARAGRYRFPAPRRRFVAARGLLRELLGAYLELDPARLRFRQNAWGKPLLLEPPEILGWNQTNDLGVRVRMQAKVKPGQQWGVARELRRQALEALHEAGIPIAHSYLQMQQTGQSK